MKKSKTITFYKRLAIASSLLCVLSVSFIFISASKYNPTPGKYETISITKANTYVKNYMHSATATNAILKGTIIDMDQLDAIDIIRNENPDASSFRIYFAKDSLGADASVIVGVDDSGNDLTNSIYSTSRKTSGVCPPVCDNNGKINSDN
ncbi:MAG: hypothetical protein KA954_15380 [Chitinophagales bacterium]|nr:hypothetical protein [Chitinophagales bacterium]MBP9550097.1 hypothetical protein [Chitinophagales bacterium]